MKIKKIRAGVGGALAGTINGLLGAAGGMAAVPALRWSGVDTTRAHATSVAVILPICILSAFVYHGAGAFAWQDALPYLPGGVAGALLGAWLLPKIPAELLRRCFGGVMIWAAVRLWMR